MIKWVSNKCKSEWNWKWRDFKAINITPIINNCKKDKGAVLIVIGMIIMAIAFFVYISTFWGLILTSLFIMFTGYVIGIDN